MAVTLYDILDVSKDAPLIKIQTAFRDLAAKFHPYNYIHEDTDTQKNAEQTLNTIIQAYKILSDTEKRRAYNAELLQSNNSYVPTFHDAASNLIRGSKLPFFFHHPPYPQTACYYFFYVQDPIDNTAHEAVERYAHSYIAPPGTLSICIYITALDLTAFMNLVSKEFQLHHYQYLEQHYKLKQLEIAYHEGANEMPPHVSIIAPYKFMEVWIDEMITRTMYLKCVKDLTKYLDDHPYSAMTHDF